MRERLGPILLVVGVGATLGLGAYFVLGQNGFTSSTSTTALAAPGTSTTSTTVPTTTTSSTVPTTTTTLLVRDPGTVPGWTVGEPWGTTPGLTMFRGNPTRTFYGSGPLGLSPAGAWRYPENPMCSTSTVGGETTVWCGNGWTGQPVVHERDDGVTELIFGAYDRSVHFVDTATGQATRERFRTGDIIKGSVTLDPDGFPLLYFGSRDNKLRILALDRAIPEQLWALDANEVDGIWNNDWDGNPVIVDDVMYVGGENGWFFAYLLNRSMGPDGLVAVDPVRLVALPGYDQDLISKSGANVSIETSVAVFDDRVYFGNSGGRVLGVDVSKVRDGEAPIVFDYYAGGDIDATIVVDEEGMLYVASEYEPSQMGSTERERAGETGQLFKLDPYADEPRVWGLDLRDGNDDAGIWATPALFDEMLYVSTHSGDLLAVDRYTGDITWSDPVGWHAWSSPVVVDGTLIAATCTGEIRGYDLTVPSEPVRSWLVDGLGGTCLEATPAVWEGTIYLGARDGYMRAFR